MCNSNGKILEANMKVPTEKLVEKELGTEMIHEFRAEVFRTLCMLRRNEANLVVRGSVRMAIEMGFWL